ncbi:hypothetical protein DLM75_02020 [Leptospira stimsonii]|uniref:Uncharacterized protein n=1 Tax=Leptospira stimsonii TaxID=2202203 RepID=A0A396ZE45_9LEPT|nr:hypothetical protein DLM75_02020 [Leptospira stimsonii]
MELCSPFTRDSEFEWKEKFVIKNHLQIKLINTLRFSEILGSGKDLIILVLFRIFVSLNNVSSVASLLLLPA